MTIEGDIKILEDALGEALDERDYFMRELLRAEARERTADILGLVEGDRIPDHYANRIGY